MRIQCASVCAPVQATKVVVIRARVYSSIRLFVYSSIRLVYIILHVRYVCSGVYSGVCSGEDEVTRRARATASSARGSRAAVDIEYAAR